jgi:hypothetical protein
MPIEESPVPTPVQMIALLAGLQIPQALYVVAKLGVATALADGPGPCRPAASGSDRPVLVDNSASGLDLRFC